jgi:hypothetical protein
MNFISNKNCSLKFEKFYDVKNFKIRSFLIFDKIQFYEICVVEVVKNKFKILYSLYFNNFVYNACSHRNTMALEWFYQCGYNIHVRSSILKIANIKILNWFRKKKFKLLFDPQNIKIEIYLGNLKFLKWLKKYNYLKVDKTYFDAIIYHEKFDVLNWMINNNYALKYISFICMKLHVNGYDYYGVLNWFRNNGVQIILDKEFVKNVKNCVFLIFKTKNNYIKGYNKN